MSRHRTKVSSLLLTVAIAIIVFIPLHSAQAGLADLAVDAFAFGTVGWMLSLARGILTFFISLLGSGINWVLSVPITDSQVVKSVWELVRNFTNMFFIIALIVMAFGTIFNIRGYDLRSLILRFLIAALLINFSLVIGGVIIDWTQSLSNVFLTAIGDVGNRLGQIFVFGNRFAPPINTSGALQANTVDLNTWQQTIAVFGDIVMLGIVFFAMAVLFVMVLIRVPILWALLIFSPIAWLTNILPKTQHIHRLWWKYFIAWNIFLPMYLFFIYIGLYIGDPAKRTQLLGTAQGSQQILGSIRIEDIFFYILISMVLIYGAKLSLSGSMAGSDFGIASSTWAKGKAAARFTGIGLARRTPGVRELEPMYQGAKNWFDQFQRKSKEKVEERADAWSKRFGVEGTDVKRFMKNVEEALKKMRDNGDVNKKTKLEDIMINPNSSPAQIVAAGKLLKEFHVDELNKDQVAKMSGAYSRAGIAEQSKYLASVNYDKQSAEDLTAMLSDGYINNVDPAFRDKFKSRVTDALIKKRKYGDMDSYMKLLNNYGNNEDDVVDALGKTDKDFLDEMSRDEAFTLFNGLKKKDGTDMQRAKKLIAEKMLKKGYFAKEGKIGADGKLERAGLENIMKLAKNGGIYDSDLEISRALKVAEEKRLISALEIRRQLHLLDKDEEGNEKSYDRVLKDRVQKLNAEGLLKVRVDEISKDSGITLTEDGGNFMNEVRSVLTKNPGRIKAITNHNNYTGEYQNLYEKIFEKIREETKERIREKNRERIRAQNKKGSESSTEVSTLPQPPQHLGGPTIMGRPEEKPTPIKKEGGSQSQIILPPEAQFKLEQEHEQARNPEEERIKSQIAKQGYMGFIIKESADAFRDKHLDWIESRVGSEWQFRPPNKKSS
ncbi:MAG: hypothetical protein A3B91_03865 [Candidatus Yanofskybacteria bacterium RIFCSPHIGHO2_02_FULL_41_29]|nr:MAG: hypothetical protein A3B91_03865 [Candidatus Yanofskybacteria bacterium RIFCSPHIGHO2_02_FULL_41_29]